MSDHLVINSETSLAEAQHTLAKLWHDNRYLEVEIVRKAKQRTLTQNRALHLWCQWMAESLNDAGFDMRRTLREDVDVPWTMTSVKEYLWRPVQEALTHKRSTTEITTVEPTEIHAVLSRHLGSRLGIEAPPWPKRKDADGTSDGQRMRRTA